MQLSNTPLKGFTVAILNGGVQDLVAPAVAWCKVARCQPVCDSSGRSQLLLQIVDAPGWACSGSIKNFHDQFFEVGKSRFQGSIRGESFAIPYGVEFC